VVRYLRRDDSVGFASASRHRLDDGLTLTTMSDVSLERVPELMSFLEQERHWLASELHDGPAQMLAQAALQNPEDRLRGALDEVIELMGWLASPALDGLVAHETLARLPADLEGQITLSPEQLPTLYRVAQDVLEGCSETARLLLEEGELRLVSSGFELSPELRERVELRCELAGLRLTWEAEGARVVWRS
jgi:hypothetical protein